MRNNLDKAKLMERNLSTFNEARKFVLEAETIRDGTRTFTSPQPVNSAGLGVNAATKSSYKRSGGKSGQKFEKSGLSERCSFCGSSKRHTREECPALKSTCHGCGKTGHWQPVCRFKNQVKTHSIKVIPKEDEIVVSGLHLKVASSSLKARSNQIEVLVSPNGSQKSAKLRFCADTGADVVIMGINQFIDSELCQFIPVENRFHNSKITGVNGRPINIFGTFQTNLSLNETNIIRDVTLVDSKDIDDAYLSLEACQGFGIVGRNFPNPSYPIISKIEKQEGDHSSEISPAPVWPVAARDEWISMLPQDPCDDDFQSVECKLRSIYREAFEESCLKPMSGPIVGDPMVITLKEGATPFAINSARNIPVPQQEPVRKMLNDMVAQGITEPVGDLPTTWCHPLVVVPKSDGSFRLCVDLTRLNTQVVHSIHPIKTPTEAISGFRPTDKYFVKLDLVKGYWQMPLEKKSQELTTFLTPFGKFRFLRSPMGFISTGDSSSYRGDMAMSGLDIQKVIDDIAAGQPEYQDLVHLTCEILERCVRYGMTVNGRKSVIGGSKCIDFVGYQISRNSIKADPEKLNAIRHFPMPEDRRDLRSFMGLVNQLGQFTSQIAVSAEPLRGLLKIKNAFLWLPEHSTDFEKIKTTLTSPPNPWDV
ncbi:uncharacterized protein LOC131888587 isoform X2 [Tigriopus californicus]|nr:uncharacterized protein LOC131888587 isoform X2 [Tigriopus californicus]